MLVYQSFQLSLPEDVVVAFVDYRLFLVVDLASLVVDLLEVLLVLEVQMPRHHVVLFGELALGDAWLPLPLLLQRPHVDQPHSAHPQHPSQLGKCFVSQVVVGEMVDDCD